MLSYIGAFQYLICPRIDSLQSPTSIDFFNTVSNTYLNSNCKVIDEINHENINSIIDNLEFRYKIFIKPRINYFTYFVVPKIKLHLQIYAAKVQLWYYQTLPYVNQFKMVVCQKFYEFKLFVINSSFYRTYVNIYVNIVYNYVEEFFGKFLQSTDIVNKKNFLMSEFKSLYHRKIKKVKPNIDVSNVVDIANDILNEESDDEEPITIRLTSTIYEVMSTGLPIENEINQLINNFEQQINRTIDLALINISNEINPKINFTIERIRPELTENFKFIQKENYNFYKKSHELISKIDKDLSNLKESGIDSYTEVVSRQDMRDVIADCRQFNEDQFNKIEGIINESFESLINEYLSIIQETINILESFAESSFTNFSNELTQVIKDSKDETFNWQSWKKFNNLKNLLFDKRDFIFDQSHYLKNKQYDKLTDSDFSNWLKFLSEITMHINFLHQDNNEYLQLIRAKANISYQLREAEEARLKEAKAGEIEEPVEQEFSILPVDEPVEEPVEEEFSILPVDEAKEQDVSILPVDEPVETAAEQEVEEAGEEEVEQEVEEVEEEEYEEEEYEEEEEEEEYDDIAIPSDGEIDDIEVDTDVDIDPED